MVAAPDLLVEARVAAAAAAAATASAAVAAAIPAEDREDGELEEGELDEPSAAPVVGTKRRLPREAQPVAPGATVPQPVYQQLSGIAAARLPWLHAAHILLPRIYTALLLRWHDDAPVVRCHAVSALADGGWPVLLTPALLRRLQPLLADRDTAVRQSALRVVAAGWLPAPGPRRLSVLCDWLAAVTTPMLIDLEGAAVGATLSTLAVHGFALWTHQDGADAEARVWTAALRDVRVRVLAPW